MLANTHTASQGDDLSTNVRSSQPLSSPNPPTPSSVSLHSLSPLRSATKSVESVPLPEDPACPTPQTQTRDRSIPVSYESHPASDAPPAAARSAQSLAGTRCRCTPPPSSDSRPAPLPNKMEEDQKRLQLPAA